MRALLGNLSPETGMAFVIIMHLDPHAKSHAASLLGKITRMAVSEIDGPTVVQPNHVYLLPPGRHVSIHDRTLTLSNRSGGEHVAMPIDRFFETLAAAEGHRAIGIVLSGTGSDGTLGLGLIKSEGGMTFAQSERTAKQFGMPGSAIAAGSVDAALAPAAMARQLEDIARHPALFGSAKGQGRGRKHADPETDLSRIFNIVRLQTGVDFSLYKRSTMQRRITRRLVLHRLDHLSEYVKLLREDVEEGDALFNDLLINVTSFFRDKVVFQALQKKIIPKLIAYHKDRPGDGELRIWVPGCATGEEVYSLAITAVECLRKAASPARLQIFGTDLSEAAISRARAGVYPASAVEKIPAEWLRRYFNQVKDSYQISRKIRDLCTFARQNVPQDPPFSRLDLISCRNVLIYLGPELQRRCFPIFHYSLNQNGHLLLGTAETVGGFGHLFSLGGEALQNLSQKSHRTCGPRSISAAARRPVPTCRKC